MKLSDVNRAITTVDNEIAMRVKVFRDKPQTRQMNIEEMQNVKDILLIVQKKMQPQQGFFE